MTVSWTLREFSAIDEKTLVFWNKQAMGSGCRKLGSYYVSVLRQTLHCCWQTVTFYYMKKKSKPMGCHGNVYDVTEDDYSSNL